VSLRVDHSPGKGFPLLHAEDQAGLVAEVMLFAGDTGMNIMGLGDLTAAKISTDGRAPSQTRRSYTNCRQD
jgi:hypothetical protein